MRSLLIGIVCAFALVAHAETISVPVLSEGWLVSFIVPEQVQMAEKPSPGKFYSIGSGVRFNVSLFVGAPTCDGSKTPSAAYRCMRPKIYSVPGVIEESISVESRPTNVQVTYIQYAKTGDVAVKVVHTHVLFERGGMWGDLHVSVVKPTVSETAALFAVGDKLDVR